MSLYAYYMCSIVSLWSIYLEVLCVFKIFISVIFSGEPDLRTGQLLVFLLCWVRFGILFLMKKGFLIPWITILLFFINFFQMKEKVGCKNQVCLYVFQRKYFIECFIFVSLILWNFMERGKFLSDRDINVL